MEDRVDAHFRACGVASLDCIGMMRHILDSLGALRIRSRSSEVSPFMRRTFNYAVLKFLEEFVDKDHEDTSAVGYLMDVFPDERKRGDGRGWLPLHWGAATEATTEADFSEIIREHPAVTIFDHSKSIQDLEPAYQRKPLYSVAEYSVIHTEGLLPLHLLVAQRRPVLTNVLSLIAANKFSVAVADGRGWLPVHWCASNCVDVDILRLLVDEFSHSLSETTKRGQLPFQLAARNRNVDVLRYLYHIHPDALLAIDLDGNSALHDAAAHFNPAAAGALLNIKPDMGLSKNFADQLPVHCLFKIIPNQKRIRQRQLETLRVFLEHHPMTATFKDRDGCLPLHLAVIYRADIEVIQLLKDVYPSSVLLKDDSGTLAVHYADDPAIQELLLTTSTPLLKAGIRSNFAKLAV